MAMNIYMDLNFFFVFQYLCRTFPMVDDHVHDAMGEVLYDYLHGFDFFLCFSVPL